VILPRGIVALAVVAILSVALNLFLAGNQLGHHFRGPGSPPNFEERLHGVWHDLPAADQPIAQDVLDHHMSEIMEKWRAFRPANQHVIQVMHADPFDPAEAKASFDIANQRSAELRTAVQNMLLEAAQKISPEGRKHIRGLGGL
jgi:uncharacterized membrane protein